jgi:hypothetical protein
MPSNNYNDEPIPSGIKVLIGFLILHTLLLLTQTWAVFQYDLMASYYLQEPRFMAEEAVVQSNRAIGLADTVVMLPLSFMAIYGLLTRKFYGVICSWMLLGTALYWPAQFIASRFTYASANIKHVNLRGEDFFICTVVFLFACWGSWLLCRSPQLIEWWKEDFPSGRGERTPLVASKK